MDLTASEKDISKNISIVKTDEFNSKVYDKKHNLLGTIKKKDGHFLCYSNPKRDRHITTQNMTEIIQFFTKAKTR